MKILVAPDSYKECLSANDVANAIKKGIKRVLPKAKCICIPMADGGEGTIDALLHAKGGDRVEVEVSDPTGRKIKACYGLLRNKKTAIIEMAAASGLMLVEKTKRNPLKASSYGTGELIIDAVEKGVNEIIIGVGGSATVDGGAGMAKALGVRFRDSRGNLIRQNINGGMLNQIAKIDMGNIHSGIRNTKFIIAADVKNKLCGKYGAARIFAPQKGATANMVDALERNLRHFARVIKKDLDIDVLSIKGAGAAGGMGAGLVAFTNASMKSGIDLIAKQVDLKNKAAGVDLIITGEGRIDAQTTHGKTVSGIIKIGNMLGVPVIAIAGSLADESHDLFNIGVNGLASAVARDMSLDDACANVSEYITNAAERTMRLIMIGKNLNILLNTEAQTITWM